MAQKLLTEVIKYYGIIPPAVRNVTASHILQESGIDIPEGIPALYAYSERYRNDKSLKKAMAKTLLRRHAGSLPDLRLVVIACGLIYLSRPIIGPMLSSAWEEMRRDVEELVTGPKARLQLEEPTPEPKTVSITAAELKELNDSADAIQARLDAAKEVQGDILTRNCELEDRVETLEDEVETLKKQIRDNAAHFNARIRGLNDQVEMEKDGRANVLLERERYRLGEKKLKGQLEELQAQFNELEDDRDECCEGEDRIQQQLDEVTVARDDLEIQVGNLQTEKEGLESALTQKNKKVTDEMQDLRKANQNLQIDIDALRSDAADNEEAAVEYQQTCDGLEQEVGELKRGLQAAGGEMAGLRAEIAALKAQLESQNSDKEEKSGAKDGGRQDENGDDASNDDEAKGTTPPRNTSALNASASEFSPSRGPGLALPDPKVAGPSGAKNAYVRKLNGDVMKKAWRSRSGMPDEDEEILLAPEDESEIGM